MLRPVYASRFDSASFRAAGLPGRSGKLLSTVAAYLGCCVRARLTLHLPSQRQLARPAVAGMVALASYLGYGGTTFARKAREGWWAHWDSNPEPKDYAYHFGFRRRPQPFVVWSTPSPWRIAL